MFGRKESSLQDLTRLEALRSTGLLDAPSEESYDRLTRLASRLLGAPVALVSLVDDRRQYFKSLLGLPEPWATLRETPLSHSFCQHVVTSEAPLLVEDSRVDDRVKGNRAIDELGVIAYAGVPLFSQSRHPLGALCVIDSKPRAWTPDEVETLNELAKSVMTEIYLRQSVKKLEEEAHVRERFIAVLAHDLKQPLSTISIGSEMISEDAGLSDVSKRTVGRVRESGELVSRTVAKLLDLARSRSSAMPLSKRSIDLSATTAQAIETLRAEFPDRKIDFATEGELRGQWDGPRLGQLVTGLLRNAVQNSPAAAPVSVAARAYGTSAELVFHNLNAGAPLPTVAGKVVFQPVIREGSGSLAHVGLGLFIADQIVTSHAGELLAESSDEKGTTLTVRLPR